MASRVTSYRDPVTDPVTDPVAPPDGAPPAPVRRALIAAPVAALAQIALAGCGASSVREGGRGGSSGIALLGVVRAPGVELPASRDVLEARVATAFERAGGRRLESAEAVRTRIDPARLEPVLEAFADTGALVPASLQMLMAAPLGYRRGLLLRIEENAVERPEPTAETVSASYGDPGVERIVQSARRRIRIAATQVDLNTGTVRPLGAWATAAEARVVHESRRRDGFVASVAASLADRMAGRPGAPPPPEAPPARAALDVLFDEIARELPTL